MAGTAGQASEKIAWIRITATKLAGKPRRAIRSIRSAGSAPRLLWMKWIAVTAKITERT